MSYSVLLAFSGCLIAVLTVFLIGMVYFLNIGLKLAKNGTEPIKILPKPTAKKIDKEAEKRELEFNERMNAINSFNGRA